MVTATITQGKVIVLQIILCFIMECISRQLLDALPLFGTGPLLSAKLISTRIFNVVHIGIPKNKCHFPFTDVLFLHFLHAICLKHNLLKACCCSFADQTEQSTWLACMTVWPMQEGLAYFLLQKRQYWFSC